MKKYFLFWGLQLLFISIYGQNGTLDPSFNSSGWKSFAFAKMGNSDFDQGYSLVQQSDGKYIFLVQSAGSSRMARYNSNGTPDNSYGSNAFSDLPGDITTQSAVLQADNKAIAGGYFYTNSGPVFGVARFKTNGTLDSSFGTNGIASQSLALPYTSVMDVRVGLDNSGRVVVAGGMFYYDNNLSDYHYGFAIVRFTSAGLLDNSFNATGSVPGTTVIDIGTQYASLYALAFLSNGNIIVGGTTMVDYHNHFILAKIISDGTGGGSLDGSFGNGGIVTSTYATGLELNALAIQGDDKIIAAGTTNLYHQNSQSYNNDFVLVRYSGADGSPDPSFNAGSTVTGTVLTDFGFDEYVNSVAVANNKIVAAGVMFSYDEVAGEYTPKIAIARYLDDGISDGSLDNSFDEDGMILSSFSGQDVANSLLVQSNDKIVVVGSSLNKDVVNLDALMARYTSSGTLDATFNASGTITGTTTLFYNPDAPSIITGVAIQPDGKILLGGAFELNTEQSYISLFALTRLNPDGTVDNSFGTNGVASANFGNTYNAMANAIAIAPVTGKIVLAGYVQWSDEINFHVDFALAQFTNEGVLDNSFDTDGMAITDFNGLQDQIYSIAIQPDGRILAGGSSQDEFNYSAQDFLLARYTTSGSLDNTFGSTGTVTVDFQGLDDHLLALTLQPDGKIVAVGAANVNEVAPRYDIALIRLNAAGVLDRRFGTIGKVVIDFPNVNSIAASVAIQGDGKILTGGLISVPDHPDSSYLAVLRYSSTGGLDRTFGSGGTVSVTFIGYNLSFLQGNAVAIQDDGKVIVTNEFEPVRSPDPNLATAAASYNNYFGVARFTSSGVLDNTWGSSGKLVSDFPYETGLRTAVWNNGRLYTGGNVYNYNDKGPSAAFVAAYTAGQMKVVLPALTINDVSVPESAGTATLTVSMDKVSTSAISINFATKDNTASSKGRTPDYKSTKGSLTIPAGSTTGFIAIPIYSDNIVENPESFFVNLSLTNAMLKLVSLDKATGTVTITDGAGLSDQYTRLNNQDKEQVVASKLAVKAMPNPSTGVFNLELQSALNTPASIRIMDISGRLIESKTGLSPNRSIQLGSNYKPGAYYAEVIQGNEKVVLKLVKQ